MSAVEQGAVVEAEQVEPRVRRPLRLAELWLLVLAVAASVGAFALVGLGVNDTLPENFWRESFALVALALVAHVVVRIKAPFADQTILPAVVLLNGVGLAMILRIQESGARGAAGADVVRNTQWSALGVVLACLVMWFLKDHRNLRKLTYTAMIASLVLLGLPLVPGIGRSINGAQIWISMFGFSLQPAEFAKITLTIFFAGYLVTNRDTLALAGPKVLGLQLPRIRDLGPLLLVWAASLAVLIFQRDLGMSLLLFGLFVAMLYLATDRVSWALIGLVLFAGGAFVAWQTFPHVAQRMTGWLNAFDPAVFNARGGSGQLVAGLFGMANGGLIGTGWGQGFPYLVPFSFSDFIFTSLAEELGLTGILAILMVYLVFVERGLRTAITVRDGFGKLLAGGLAFTIALQTFVVVGGVTRLIPLTGLTLPFMAQGGSSLLSNWILAGLLLKISDSARRPSSLPMRGQVGQGRIVPDDAGSPAIPSTLPTQVITPDLPKEGER
ncbi:cell cycle protein [Xylanimonas cellulosilytica DSM 15894]|uniref:Cell cycle protein n=1 Tax=Xylanimonas cellulosilytica (strain DSM 15894 / JCM 12276 / CECT 5975 / KCTC 9989 / LMG 20990 / NBRC 107835 / XIL07) TaxID=446471 RepID=D1BTC0_XYLCX|nr:FtsW/RodA/SpoVE family cell cycle protein [Xylanimonas cellulosilytica]ACZ29062.1 cell cycle protein [Xylanimonas cellulosilytica DSM 15894]